MTFKRATPCEKQLRNKVHFGPRVLLKFRIETAEVDNTSADP